LLENGSQFSSVITSQANSPLALAATAKVTNVLAYRDHRGSGQLRHLPVRQVGAARPDWVAVYQDGVWKVGDTSFCCAAQA